MAFQSPHDALFRAAFESPQHAAELLAAVLPRGLLRLVALDSLELQSGGGRGKDLEEFRSDLLFRARIGGDDGYVGFLLEHQSTCDGGMLLRVLGYQLRIWERHYRAHPGQLLPPIVAIVVSHDPRGWRAPRDFSSLVSRVIRQHPLLRALTPRFRCIVVDLTRLSDADLKRRALSAFPALVLWALRDARTPGQILHTLDYWADALTDVANAADGRDALGQLFRYISTVADHLAFDQFRNRVAQLAPAAQESIMTIAEELKALGMKQGLEKGLRQGLKEGLEKGLEKGREEGLEHGLARGKRQTLEKLMALKFGPVPEAVSERIREAELAQLERWLERILTADTAAGVVEL